MLNTVTKALAKLFGTKSDRDIKLLLPIVAQVNEVYATLSKLSDDEIRGKSQQLKAHIAKELTGIDADIDSLRHQVQQPELGLEAKEALFNQIDEKGKERNKQLEVVLAAILPEAFAIVKETARRLKENKQLVVTATEFDIEQAALNNGVVLDGDKAIWKNEWLAAGAHVTWDMLHYDVQIIGGIVLHQGKISEMATGEGKTLVATLPAFLNALARQGVHIVTVNDYLAKRDSEWMAPIFQFHLIRVDCIDKHQPNSEERRQAYAADITYGTNNEFGFDYLRDNMAREPEELVQRKLHYAMVDEVDSVLIDDARTPLIISGPMSRDSSEALFEALKPRVAALVEAQKAVVNEYLREARSKIAAGDEKEGGLALFRAYRGLPKSRPLIKFLSETGMRALLQKTENGFLEDNSRKMPEADRPLFFVIDERHNTIDLTTKGTDFITGRGEDPHFFIVPDLSTELAKVDKNKDLGEDDKLTRKDIIVKEYSEKTERIHIIQQLLKAYTLFEKEVEYIITDGKVKIVDEQTGRIMEGRRYSDGLHQAIEAKENVKIEEATQTYATVTLQNYFRMYHKLAGMTGTAETEAGEFWQIYKLDVVVIPTNRDITRKDGNDKVYKTTREKYNAVTEEIEGLVKAGRPVLVGTTSVENSELISRLLKLRKIEHQVLNAKLHQKEAEIIVEAGKSGTVTIATNMAGRGTDIKLSPESKAAGGLAIVGTERHESRRVDRQLRGRAGRQGDPGSSQFFVSLEDHLMRLFGSDRIAKLMDRMGIEEGEVIQNSLITRSIENAQKKVEENNFGIRKRLLEYDDVMNSQREVIYKRRRSALFGERLELDIMNMIYETCAVLTEQNKRNFEDFKLAVVGVFGHAPHTISEDTFRKGNNQQITQLMYQEMFAIYSEKTKNLGESAQPILANIKNTPDNQFENIVFLVTDFTQQMQVVVNIDDAIATNGKAIAESIEKLSVLNLIDNSWKEHLRDMDDLKQSVQTASYEQKDPLLIYKFSALDLFRNMIATVNRNVVSYLFHYVIPQDEAPREAVNIPQAPQPQYIESHDGIEGEYAETHRNEDAAPVKQAPVRKAVLPNRNDKVSVRYPNGEVKRDVKFKTVEEDVLANRCILID